MAEYLNHEAAGTSVCNQKNRIKTHFAKIIVSGTSEKPCYDILYFDPTDRKYHIGFGSYCLDYVFKWLAEEFEIEEAVPTADLDCEGCVWLNTRHQQFDICEDTPFLAEARLHQKIGDDAKKWRFEARRLPDRKITLVKRVKYAGDVYSALVALGWDFDTAAAFLDCIPDAK